jgi:hypothetical protein
MTDTIDGVAAKAAGQEPLASARDRWAEPSRRSVTTRQSAQ